jgi:hypothetical protein
MRANVLKALAVLTNCLLRARPREPAIPHSICNRMLHSFNAGTTTVIWFALWLGIPIVCLDLMTS